MPKKVTLEEFINCANKIHSNKYDYSKFEYINNVTKSTIICKKHDIEFLQRPSAHLRGSGCIKCGFEPLKIQLNEFLQKAIEKYKDKYDYSLITEIESKMKLPIVCKKHGVWYTIASQHLKGVECPICRKSHKRVDFDKNKELFFTKANKLHNNKYDYSKSIYVSSQSKILITCPFHGDFLQKCSHHLSGSGCRKCSTEKNTLLHKDTNDSFIRKAKLIHGDTYDYSVTKYELSCKKVKVLCKIHGIFEIKPNQHLTNKSGCQKCSAISRNKKLSENNLGSWTRTGWIKRCKDKLATLYVVICYLEDEKFYKIGITSRTLKERFGAKNITYEEVLILQSYSAAMIYDLEKILLRYHKPYKFLSKYNFGGRHECFSQVDLDLINKEYNILNEKT